ncbi:DUF4148 domain-containing protein [Trinickia soli]|uniref:DUF4148 domain-containing protein n=1 Tax=Trinickia soli TaxID=380675 RepID=A0A2N7WFZ5_9BURK|nr:DUF4148 domain-containing protein [Trinickia soli]KAA0088951.1 DUF4148 domain-containing protein [Paraburkholderia sp. T12-10]PMS28281.1 hypothetical protein C0Z19_00690 [Trinickia soli]CAB3661939.1 hypothetical protein LMG24076_01487 [Trinickia soli]
MKSLVYAVVAASALSVSLASFAQTTNNGPVTRAQVRQELIQLEQAGYNPAQRDPMYPDDIQAAEQRVHQEQGAAVANAETSGYGGVAAGSSQSGAAVQAERPISAEGVQPVFFGR